MNREDYQKLEMLLNMAVLAAIINKQYDVANALHTVLNKLQDTYIWPDDLSTL